MAWNIDGLLERIGLLQDNSIGLAMSGGGARGFSHIGVLMAFERFGIKPDVMAGVSAGSIAVALYGAGLSPLEIQECFAEASGMSDFTEWTIPKEGLMRLNRFGKLLESWLPVKNLEEMRIPTVICATDIEHGKAIGWLKGEIVPRVLASCSIPVVFAPVKINGINYVDGGVLRNLPAWAIRKSCKTLYGSNCSPLSRDYHFKPSVLDIALRSYQLMSKANTLQDLRLCDHIIQSSIMSQYKTFQLSILHKAVKHGYDAACRVLEKGLEK